MAEIPQLFRENIFPRRALKYDQPLHFSDALRLYQHIEKEEEKWGIKPLLLGTDSYPAALLRAVAPERLPPVLYLRGNLLPEEKNSVAVVGTRNPSHLGREAASNFAAYFTMMGIHIVSGLAKGVDTIAHRENLRIGTVAVLGSGLHGIYPAENAELAEEILEKKGSLLSPFPLGQVPLPHNFPQRNELIAGLSTGTVVIEGKETSGAAVTGKQALSMGKTVVALPQDFRTDFGRGAIRLQQAGALLVATEEEALHGLFYRWGGFGQTSIPLTRQRIFSFQDFRTAAGTDVTKTITLLEEGIVAGRFEKVGPDLYRLLPQKNGS